MECSVCFDLCDKPCRLTCTHTFCRPCLVKWLESPTQLESPSCPMCRGPILFKGLLKIRDTLEETRWHSAYDDTYGELFDELIENEKLQAAVWNEAAEILPAFSRFYRRMGREIMTEHCVVMLRKLERTFVAMKSNGEHPEFITDFVTETNINYEKEIRREQRKDWKSREPFRLCTPRRGHVMRRTFSV